MVAGYASRVRRDIERWLQAGLIDAMVAEALRRDVDLHDRRSLSFGSVLAVMAALLVAAALLVFVASNWQAVPRPARVVALFAVIFAGYVGGAVLKLRDHAAIAEGVWLVAAAAFGCSIALIGQMYHLSGDENRAILTWCAGTALAAAALRSGPLTVAAVALASAWLFLRGVDMWRPASFPYGFAILAAGLWLLSLWTQSTPARHLLLLSLVFFAVMLASEHDPVATGLVLGAVSVAAFALAVLLPEPVERLVRIGGRLPLHALAGFLTALFLVQFQFADGIGADGGFALAAAAGLAGIVAAIVLAGRESRGLRWLAYAGFAGELCMIYVVMIQNMLDTAGFFLVAGLLLGLFAIAIIRVEKRMRLSGGTQGAAA